MAVADRARAGGPRPTRSREPRRRLTAIIAPEPFTPRTAQVLYPEGETIAQMLTRAVAAGALDANDLGCTEVFIDGEQLVDREAALDVRPSAGQVVNIAVMPMGGGGGRGGGNKTLQTVLQLAVIAASYFVGGPLAAGASAKTTMALRAAAAAIQIGGQMAIAAAFAPKLDNLAAQQSYSLTSQSNQARPRQSMVLALGEGRMALDLVSSAITSVNGDDVFITAIYGAHFGACTLADLKLGETLFADLPDGEVQMEQFLTPGPRVSTLYPMRTVQAGYTEELEFTGSTPGAWVVKTTAPDTEAFEIDVTFPNGLYLAKSNGKTLPQEVRGTVEYSPAGANAWQAAPLDQTYFSRTGAAMPEGDWYFQGRARRAVRRTVRVVPPAKGQFDVRVRAWDPDNDDPDESTYTTQWTAMRSIEAKAAIVDQTLSVIVVRFKAASSVNGALPTISAVVTPIVPIWTPPAGPVQGHWNTSAPTSNAAALARWLVTGPAAMRPLLPGQVDVSFATAYQLIEDNDWKGAVQLKDEVSQQDALVRLGFMGRFSTYWNGQKLCAVTDWERPAARQMFTGRNAQDYKYTRAFPDAIHGVVVEFGNLDQDGDADQLVVYADGFSKTGGLVEGVMTQAASILPTFELPFAATMNRAHREGRVWLAKRLYQSESHAWAAGSDGLVSTFGDRILVRHVSTLFGEAEARVQNRRFSGALVSGLRLDTAVTMEEGKTYAIDLRRADRTIRGLALVTTPGTTRDLVFAVPKAEEDAPEKDDLVAFGVVNVITEDLELVDIAPRSRTSIGLRAQPYRFADIQAAETGPIPPLQSLLTARAKAPTPIILAADGSPDGAVISFSVDSQRSSPIKAFYGRWRPTPSEPTPSPGWTTLDPIAAESRELRTPAFPDAVHIAGDEEGEYRIDVQVRTVLQNGDISAPGSVEGLLIQRGVPVPVNFTAVGVKRIAEDGSSYPVIACSADAIEAGIVADLIVQKKDAGAADDTYISAGEPLPAANPRGDYNSVKGGNDYDVRACWRSADGWSSGWVVRAGVHVPGGALVAHPTVNTIVTINEAAAAARAAALLAIEEVADRAFAVDIVERATRTPDGLPVGPTTREQMTITENAVETISLMAVKTLDASAVIWQRDTVIVDEATGETWAEHDASLLAADEDALAILALEEIARIDGDEAEALARLALAATVAGNKALADAALLTLSDADSAMAARALVLEALTRSGSPSRTINGDFSDGWRGWLSSTGSFANWNYGIDVNRGSLAFSVSGTVGDHIYQDISAQPGVSYTMSLEGDGGAASQSYFQILNAAKSVVLATSTTASPTSWTNPRSKTNTVTAPAGGVYIRQFVKRAAVGGFAFSRIMTQEGPATAWRDDATVGSALARLTNEEIVRTSEDLALAASHLALETEVDGNKASADSSITALTTATEAVADSLDLLQVEVDDNRASAESSITALADETSAAVASLDLLEIAVDGHTADLAVFGSALGDINDSLAVVYGFKLGVDGKVIGMVAINDGVGGAPDTITFDSDGVNITGDLFVGGQIHRTGMADGSVHVSEYAFTNSLLNGTGGTQIGLYALVDLEADCIVSATACIAWAFPSGDQSWSCDMRIDGVTVFSTSGARSVDLTPLSGQQFCTGGRTISVDIRFSGNSNVRWAARNISVAGAYILGV